MQIVAVANQKGGVAKTTTCITLCHGLALQGWRVLIVDLDPQGHVAPSLGKPKAPGLHRLLVEKQPARAVVTAARPNLDIIAGNKATESVKRDLIADPFGFDALARALKMVDYDAILLDCAPSLDILHLCALVAADLLLVPTKLDFLAIDGVNEALHSIAQVKERGYGVELAAVLPTFFDRVTKETHEQLTRLVTAFGSYVWPPIPTDTKLREAPAYGRSIWEYAPSAPGLVGYPNGKGHIGGYKAAMDRLLEVLE